MATPAVPLHQVPDISHPYADLSLSAVINLAQSYQRLHNGPEPESLADIRSIITVMIDTAMYNWLTGKVALDLLDAAIDGKDLIKHARFR